MPSSTLRIAGGREATAGPTAAPEHAGHRRPAAWAPAGPGRRASGRGNAPASPLPGRRTSTWRRFHTMPISSTPRIRLFSTGLVAKALASCGASSAATTKHHRQEAEHAPEEAEGWGHRPGSGSGRAADIRRTASAALGGAAQGADIDPGRRQPAGRQGLFTARRAGQADPPGGRDIGAGRWPGRSAPRARPAQRRGGGQARRGPFGGRWWHFRRPRRSATARPPCGSASIPAAG